MVLGEVSVGGKEGRERWEKKRGEIEIALTFFSFFVSELR